MITNPETPQRRSLGRIIRAFAPYYGDQWKALSAGLLCILVGSLLTLATPWPLTLILDSVVLHLPMPGEFGVVSKWSGGDPTLLLGILVLAFFSLRILDHALSSLKRIWFLRAGERFASEIRTSVYERLQRLSPSFHGSSRSGDLVYRLTSDVSALKGIFIEVPHQFLYRLISMTAHLGLMLVLEWRLALIAFALLPILYMLQFQVGKRVRKLARRKKEKESDVSALVLESLTAMTLVQAYGREESQAKRFESENRLSLASDIAGSRLYKGSKRTVEILLAVGTASVLYFGGLLAMGEAIRPGILVLFVTYLGRLHRPIKKIAHIILDLEKGLVSANRVLDILESRSIMQDHPKAVSAPTLQGEVTFRNVTFGYEEGAPVLRNITFTIPAGATVALLGQSGAGKSTLASLLMRLHDPWQGQILFDGQDIRSFTRESLRAQMSILLQDSPYLPGTIFENIAWGQPGASLQQVIQAAKLAQAHEFITRLPEGYETQVGESGRTLSGGQGRRLGLARALVRNAPLIILDEPADALDESTASRIQIATEQLTRGRTTFIIAHRSSSISKADRVLLLAEGRLIANGPRVDVKETSREYRELHTEDCS